MLSDREKVVLNIESRYWRTTAGKETAMRAAGLSSTRYYQILSSLTGRADGWEYAPQALARVVRLRERNRLRRSA